MPENLLPNPTANPATLLPEEPEVTAALAADAPVSSVVVSHPSSSLAWALLADEAWARGATLESYAYARVGYHRASTPCGRRAGAVPGRCRGRTSRTAACSVRCSPCAARRPRSRSRASPSA